MNIAIFGLGYVGSVSAACLAAAGHRVIGVDVDPYKVDLIRRGRAPITEPELDELLSPLVADGRISVTSDTAEAIASADVSLVCVGTPSRRNGSLDSSYLERVLEQIGEALSHSNRYHVIAVRSTLLPGVLGTQLVPLLERVSGRRAGVDFGVCINPEFLREGSAIRDFLKPPFTVIGEGDSRAGDTLAGLYEHLKAPVYRMLPDEASMLKYACNTFHAVKVAFANEIGALCESLGMDGQRVMDVFCKDAELNVSPRYLRPGFAFGGSCLPKDLRALTYVAKDNDVSTPLLSSVLSSNDAHIRRVVDVVLDSGKRSVAMLGLSFKRGSDDLRESPFVTLAESLIGKGLALKVCDPDIALGKLVGRNRAYIDEKLPHLAQLMAGDMEQLIEHADVVIVAKRIGDPATLSRLTSGKPLVVDLVGITELGSEAVRPWLRKNPEAIATYAV